MPDDAPTPQSPPARLTLRGHEPTPAELELSVIPRGTRTRRALGYLLGFWILIPLVFFIPPHVPWVLAAFFAGIYLAHRHWTGEYVVHRFLGRCPRCGAELTIPPETRIRLPHAINCFQCHHQSVLEVGVRA